MGAGVPRTGAHARTCAHLVALAALVGSPYPSREQSASCVIASGAEKFAERLLLLLLAPAPTRALEVGDQRASGGAGMKTSVSVLPPLPLL